MAWLITKDRLAGIVKDAAGTIGPGTTKLDAAAIKAHPKAVAFRMLDDDGAVYFEGLNTAGETFAPLDDFGMPDSGCTEIQYRNASGTWETL